jgi:hypothetical protein
MEAFKAKIEDLVRSKVPASDLASMASASSPQQLTGSAAGTSNAASPAVKVI